MSSRIEFGVVADVLLVQLVVVGRVVGQGVEDVRGEADEAGQGEGRAGVRDVLLRNLVAGDDEHGRVDALGLRAREEAADGVRAVVLEHHAAVLDARVVEHARLRLFGLRRYRLTLRDGELATVAAAPAMKDACP